MVEREGRDRLVSGLIQVISDGGFVERDGLRKLDFSAVFDALGMTLAVLLSQLPAARVDEVARGISNWLADDVLRRMREVRAFCDETGYRPFDPEEAP